MNYPKSFGGQWNILSQSFAHLLNKKVRPRNCKGGRISVRFEPFGDFFGPRNILRNNRKIIPLIVIGMRGPHDYFLSEPLILIGRNFSVLLHKSGFIRCFFVIDSFLRLIKFSFKLQEENVTAVMAKIPLLIFVFIFCMFKYIKVWITAFKKRFKIYILRSIPS